MFLLNLNLMKRRNKYSKVPDNQITTVEMSPKNTDSPKERSGIGGDCIQIKNYLQTDGSGEMAISDE